MAITTEHTEQVGDLELARVRVSYPENPSADVVEWEALCEICDDYVVAGVSEAEARSAIAGHEHVLEATGEGS